MPIKDYTTSIPVGRTIGEIQDVLARFGAERVMTVYEDRQPVAVEFVLDAPYGAARYQLPANVPAMLAVLERDKRGNARVQATPEQANRVAWRVIKDWIEAQLALVETRMVAIDRVMLPYLVLSEGRTLYDAILAHEFPLALPPGGAS